MDTNCLGFNIIQDKLLYYNIKWLEILMTYFYECIRMENTEQIIISIIVLATNLKIGKNKNK